MNEKRRKRSDGGRGSGERGAGRGTRKEIKKRLKGRKG